MLRSTTKNICRQSNIIEWGINSQLLNIMTHNIAHKICHNILFKELRAKKLKCMQGMIAILTRHNPKQEFKEKMVVEYTKQLHIYKHTKFLKDIELHTQKKKDLKKKVP